MQDGVVLPPPFEGIDTCELPPSADEDDPVDELISGFVKACNDEADIDLPPSVER